MIWLLAGVLCLVLILISLKAIANARPEALRKAMVTAGLLLAILLGLILLFTGRPAFALPLLASALAGLLKRQALARLLGVRQSWQARGQGAGGGQTSSIRTAWLALILDHDSGRLTGHILKGAFKGRAFESLTLEECLALHREIGADDPESLQLLEASMDRLFGPDWRAGEGRAEDQASRRKSGAMSREEAAAILGLEPDADPRAIRAAHRDLMKKLHPDHGGNSYFAAKLNEARDRLLKSAF